MLLRVAEHEINYQDEGGDSVGWLAPENSKFTVRSAYLLLRGEGPNSAWEGWKRIWQLKAQERIKVFMWLLAHDKILTNASRWRRHLTSNPCCFRCDAVVEDGLHVIRDCKGSKEVWECFIPPPLWRNFFIQELQDWLLMNLTFRGGDDSEVGWPEMMGLISWSVWKWRCSQCFENKCLTIDQKVEWLRHTSLEMSKAFSKSPVHRERDRNEFVMGKV